jgi:hypothetical protein
MDATVKPATDTKKSRFSPNRAARKPVGGVMMAAATRSWLAETLPWT